MAVSTSTPTTPPLRDDVQPVANERLDRFLTGTVTVIPFIGLGVAAWQTWNSLLHWHDIVVFFLMYFVCALGVTIGFHRHFTHRAFKTSPFFRGMLAAMGSMAIEGPITAWVADHRKHHAFADEEGDPHSPHVDHGGGLKGTLQGLFHAHVGWLFIHNQRALKTRYAKDLIEDPVVSRIDRQFLFWVFAGLAIPFALGGLLSWSWQGALTGLLWGGAIRMLVVHHVTYSINSICHVFGRKQYATRDESRNVWWLALPTMGEAWHNSHHAFPTAAHHGMDKRQIDVSGSIITLLERLGIIWDVVRVPEDQRAKRAVDAQRASAAS